MTPIHYTEGVLHFRSYPRLRAVLRLAVAGKVSASTRNHAQSALLFLYRLVLGFYLPCLTDVASACAVAALKLRQEGLPYPEIGARLGCGGATALRYVRGSLERIAKEDEAEAKMLMALELTRLDALAVAAHEMLDATHYLTGGGRIIEHNGAELRDTGPILRVD